MLGRRRGRRDLVGLGPCGARARAVVDPEPQAHGHLRAERLDALGERAVEQDGCGLGVVPEVDELVLDVAVVRVDRHEPGLRAGEERLEVLVAVVEVLGDRLAAPHAGAGEPRGHAAGAAVELGPGAPLTAVNQGRGLGDERGDVLPHVGEGPARHSGGS